MKKGYSIALFFVLLHLIAVAQTVEKNEKRGTIKVKKIAAEGKAPIPGLKKQPVVPRITSFNFRRGGRDYKITFPKSYTANLYPLVFNNRGLVLTDGYKTITEDIPQTFNYDLFVNNIFITKKEGDTGFGLMQMFQQMMASGSFVWVSHLSFKDKNGVLHTDEIQEFKVQRLN